MQFIFRGHSHFSTFKNEIELNKVKINLSELRFE